GKQCLKGCRVGNTVRAGNEKGQTNEFFTIYLTIFYVIFVGIYTILSKHDNISRDYSY
ncbi:unnamed protein product, partial [marine sediment metagenome]